jgi:hypothetical protein
MSTLENKTTAPALEPLRGETAKSFAAFKVYLDMGPHRSLAAAASKIGSTKARMCWLSSKYDWRGRVAAHNHHSAELERQAIERLACEKAVEWWQLQEPVRRQAWLEAEEAIAMVREARKRWRESDRMPTFEGMARMLDLAFKLKQFAAGMPSEIKEVHNLHAGKVSLEWEDAIRKAYHQAGPGPNQSPPAAIVDAEVVSTAEVKP